mmetsp:Transcript_43434/g.137285  ORF Transcript_43434/g.137285 Transcript_43434/m.137285 type:complete len:126 (-) Transcript_43434:2708-3085(-)
MSSVPNAPQTWRSVSTFCLTRLVCWELQSKEALWWARPGVLLKPTHRTSRFQPCQGSADLAVPIWLLYLICSDVQTIWLGTPEKKNAYPALPKGTSLPCDAVIKLDLESANQASAFIQVSIPCYL